MQVSDIVNGYLTALYSGDFDKAATYLADDFSFVGPFVEARGCDAFLSSAEGLKRIAAGHTLLRQIEAGNTVCSLYDLHFRTPGGAYAIPMSEWHTVRNGHLSTGAVFFDARRFTEMLENAGKPS